MPRPYMLKAHTLLTHSAGGSIVAEWYRPDANAMEEDRIEALHGKVDDLIALCGKLREENQLLKDNEQNLRTERRQLLEKNREAKQRLQAILMRLKALEHA